jgi:hypothetical protein
MKSSSIASFEENSIEESSFESESLDFDESVRVNNEDDFDENTIRYSNLNHNNDAYSKIGKNQSNNLTKQNNNLKSIRKRKCRTTFNKSQLNTLENEFLKSNFVSNDRIHDLIELTGLDSRIIKVFINSISITFFLFFKFILEYC